LSDSINNEGAQHQRFESAAEAAGAAGAACVTATAGGEGQSTTFKSPHILLDVRPSHQFEICSLPGALNIPLKDLKGSLDMLRKRQEVRRLLPSTNDVRDSNSPLLPVL
jgi:hypothetical protein